MTQRSARPCPGPHRGKEPPLTAQPFCDFCRNIIRTAIEQLPEQYIAAYLALEPGQRGRDNEDGGRRSRNAEAPLPLDGEADALMRRILEVVLSWHGPVVLAAKLAHTLPESPVSSTSGVALSSTCALLLRHLDTLLGLPMQPITRTIAPHQVAAKSRHVFVGHVDSAPEPSKLIGRPLLSDETEGRVMADGRAIVILDLDGVAAGLEMLELARDAERTLGRTLRTVNLERPCPNPDCCERELHHTEGDDFVRCRACGEKHFATQYDRLAVVLGADPGTSETVEAS